MVCLKELCYRWDGVIRRTAYRTRSASYSFLVCGFYRERKQFRSNSKYSLSNLHC